MYDLQKIDCNCNDCKFMERDMSRFNVSLEKQRQWQLYYFHTIQKKAINAAKWWKDEKNDLEKWDRLLTEAENMKFQFDKKHAAISFGNCTKLNKPVSFIPVTCQLDTQECFVHRKD